MLRLVRHLAFLLSLAVLASLARDARADAADAATAQALFDQGVKLMGEKKFSEACPKFAESQRLDPGLGTQMNLAYCYEMMGRTASAWSLYLEVAGQAKSSGQPEREKKARDAAKALEPKLSKLTIEVESPPEGLEVKRDGQLVGQATWGTPIPVDPGEIKITAMAPNRKLWETAVTVEKPGNTTVSVPELEKGQTPVGYGGNTNPGPTATGPAYYGSQVPPPVLPPPMKRRSPGMFGGGIAMVVVGGLAAITGGLWAVVADGLGGEVGPGAGLALVGLGLVGGGTAMIVIGGKKVPATVGAPVLVPSPVPEVKIGLGAAEAKWVF